MGPDAGVVGHTQWAPWLAAWWSSDSGRPDLKCEVTSLAPATLSPALLGLFAPPCLSESAAPGVPLNHLVGQRFRVGAVVLFGGRLNFPRKYLEKLLGLPVYLPLYNRSGLNCRIEKGGIVRRGDPVEPFDDR